MHTDGSNDSRVVVMGQGLMLGTLSYTAEDTPALYRFAVTAGSTRQVVEQVVELAVHLAEAAADDGVGLHATVL